MTKKRRFGLEALLLTVFLAAGSPQPVTAQGPAAGTGDRYEDAVDRFEKGDLEGAAIQLKNVLQQDPDQLPARILLARVHLDAGDGKAAEKELLLARGMGADPALIAVPLARAYSLQGRNGEVISRIDAEDFAGTVKGEVLLWQGKAHLELGELDEAEAAFTRAGELLGGKVPSLLGRAAVYMERGDHPAAAGLLEQAEERRPGNPEIWYLKGQLARLQGDRDAAIAAYDRAIALAPRHLLARTAKAALLVDGLLTGAGGRQEAAAEIGFVRETDDLDPHAAYLDALVRSRGGDMAGARRAMAEALEIMAALPPEFIERHRPSLLLTGVLHFTQGNYDQAHRWLATYVRKYPRHARARRLLGAVLLERDDPLEALEVMAPALNWTPEDARLHLLMGRAYMRVKRFDDAERMFAKAAELAPDDAAVRSQLATSRLQLGQEEAAMTDLRAAFELNPGALAAGLMLGRLQLGAGQTDAALTTAEALVARGPRNPAHHNLLGAARMAGGDVDGARQAFGQALAVDGAFVPAALNLARLHRRSGDYEAARRLYQEIRQRDPADIRALEGLAEVAAAKDDDKGAVELLEKVRAMAPEVLGPQLRLVDLYLQTGDSEAAAERARELESRYPEHLGVLAAVGRGELARGERERAVVTFRRMSKIAFYSADQLKAIGELQLAAEDLDGAYWTFLKAAEARPDDLAVQGDLVAIEVRQGKLEKALERAEGVRDADPQSPLGDTLTGDVLMADGRYGAAAAAYRAALDKAPGAARVVRLHRALAASGDPGGGIAALEAWLADHPEDGAVRLVLASAYSRHGRTDAAIAAYERLVAGGSEAPAVLNNLAALYQRVGDPRARPTAERAYRAAPEDAAVLDTYGWILVEDGEPREGLKLLRQAYSRASRVPEVRYHLGAALARLGQEGEAERVLEALVAEAPESAAAGQARQLLLRLRDG